MASSRFSGIRGQFALILALAAVVPLIAYGLVSIVSLRSGTRESVVAGNQGIAKRAAEEIRRYVSGHAEILKALASQLQNTGLDQWQQTTILRNYVLQFHEFRELTLFDDSQGVIASSRVGAPHVSVPADAPVMFERVAMSPIRVDDDLLPTSVFAVPLTRLNRPAGWLVGELNLEEMWRVVDNIRIDQRGFALVAAPDGALVAHGDPDKKTLVARAANISSHPLLAPGQGGAGWQQFQDETTGTELLAVAAKIEPLGWTLIVEQPTSEAYADARRLQRQLSIAIAFALTAMVAVGLVFGRRFIAPIFTLQRATQGVAAGDLETRVHIRGGNEFADLGRAFNTMADRLVELQENVKRQERQAMFGRIAAGLFHDLSHPIQNLGNSARLLAREDIDAESRETFQRTIEREVSALKRFMDDLRNIARPKPIERFAMDINAAVAEMVDSMRPEGERNGIAVAARYADGPLTIDGDRFALGRVFRNLITNAIQATEPGGHIAVETTRAGEHVQVTVADTGSGIPADRLSKIFDDFVTTKRRGLGLGLAISKRIVEQLNGTISVESEVGRGTTFTMRFPARDVQPQAAAS
jgi:signal transduction histidine kinase